MPQAWEPGQAPPTNTNRSHGVAGATPQHSHPPRPRNSPPPGSLSCLWLHTDLPPASSPGGPRSSPCPISRDTARPSFKSSVAPDPSPLTPPPPPALAQTCGLERPVGLASGPISKGSLCQDQSPPLHTLGLTPDEILLLRVQLKRHHFHDALPDHPLQPPLLSESSEARGPQITDYPAQPGPHPLPDPFLGRKGGGTRAEADRWGAGEDGGGAAGDCPAGTDTVRASGPGHG